MSTDAHAGRTYLVVGAGGGIGTALCGRLSSAGAELVVAGRDTTNLSSIASSSGARAERLDARDHAAVDALTSSIARERPLHGVVNLAGSIILRPAHATTPDDLADTLATNLTTAFNIVRSAAKVMQRQEGGGAVVLMSSAVARHGYPAHEAISAAKAGVEALARSAASTYATKGVRFNCVAPGLTRTPLAANIFASEPMLRASLDMHADRHAAEPEQVASAIAWLLAEEQRHVTGQVLGVDGGLATVHAK